MTGISLDISYYRIIQYPITYNKTDQYENTYF